MNKKGFLLATATVLLMAFLVFAGALWVRFCSHLDDGIKGLVLFIVPLVFYLWLILGVSFSQK